MTRYWASSSVKLTSIIFNLPGGLWPLPYPTSEAGRELQQVFIWVDLQRYLCHHLICEGVVQGGPGLNPGWPVGLQPTGWCCAHSSVNSGFPGTWCSPSPQRSHWATSHQSPLWSVQCCTQWYHSSSVKVPAKDDINTACGVTKMLPSLQVLSIVVT